MAEVKLPLRKLNVWISVKVDMETHLRLPQASREEIKPEMDVPVARGRTARWDGRWGNRCDWEWKLKAREGTRGACAGAPGGADSPRTLQGCDWKVVFIQFQTLPSSGSINSSGLREATGMAAGGHLPPGAPPSSTHPPSLPTGGCKS